LSNSYPSGWKKNQKDWYRVGRECFGMSKFARRAGQKSCGHHVCRRKAGGETPREKGEDFSNAAGEWTRTQSRELISVGLLQFLLVMASEES